MFARAIHYEGARQTGPFVHVNCGALPESLVESELFGHVKGAFTDARSSKRGLFEVADHGTLFLDEVGTLPLGSQAKVLTAIDRGIIRPVGGADEIVVNVHLVAAMNNDPARRVAEGKFRTDLYHRLRVMHIELPPLRRRGADVDLLTDHFLRKSSRKFSMPEKKLSDAARRAIRAYRWPGNVRELSHCMESALLLSGDAIDVGSMPMLTSARDESRGSLPAEAVDSIRLDFSNGPIPLEYVERTVIARAMAETHNNISHAARLLDLSRDSMRYRLEKHGFQTQRSRKWKVENRKWKVESRKSKIESRKWKKATVMMTDSVSPVENRCHTHRVGRCMACATIMSSVCVCFFVPVSVFGQFVVDAGGGGTHTTIQAAIAAAADGFEIVVMPGVYLERINFGGKAVRVRSASPLDRTVVDATIVDGGGMGPVVTFESGEGSGSVLQGMTIRGGRSDADGGGIFCVADSSPRVIHNVIALNVGVNNGGGVYCADGANPQLEYNVIFGNRCGARGGGIYAEASSPVLRHNIIDGNLAGCSAGGGMYLAAGTDAAVVEANDITRNFARFGGGIAVADANVRIERNRLINNYGIPRAGALSLSNADVTMVSNVIAGNKSDVAAGCDSAQSSPVMRGNTFVGNWATDDVILLFLERAADFSPRGRPRGRDHRTRRWRFRR